MTNLFVVFVASARLFPERAEQVTSGARASAGHTTRGAARRSRPAREPLRTTTTVFLRFTGGYYTGQVTYDLRSWLKPKNLNNKLCYCCNSNMKNRF